MLNERDYKKINNFDEQVKEELKSIYRDRLRNIKVRNGHDLQELLEEDSRLFNFQLFYFYLSDRDLSDIAETMTNGVLIAISYFVRVCDDEDITNYFAKFIHLFEYEQQITKIYKEQGIIKAKLNFLETNNFSSARGKHHAR